MIASQERRDDAVRRPGHPAGVGSAPEYVIGMQIERIAAGDVMREYRLVDVHRTLWAASSAACEMQKREIFRIGGGKARLGAGSRHCGSKIDRAGEG